ncbi:MAG: hypothetical protein K2O34_14485 [Acetatifactor sp.]|nr:hypothetical protein [Acetatifactor sp.]
MAHEKFSDDQKKCVAKLNPCGPNVELLSRLTGVSKATVYKAKREGRLLNKLDRVEQEKRELIVKNQLLQSMLSQKESKQRRRHS